MSVNIYRNGRRNDLYRKDVLFYTVQLDKDELKRVIHSFDLADETLHFGELGVYWGKHDKTSYNQTVYHKNLLKSSFYCLYYDSKCKNFFKHWSLFEKIRN